MALRKKPKIKRSSSDQITPPEGVPINLKIAGFGVRLGAQIIDIIITVIAAIAAILFVAFVLNSFSHSVTAIMMLILFLIRVPYYIFTELLWNGQTLGKRLLKIKVVSHDGGALTVHALVTRNIMKEAEVFLPGTLVLTLDATEPVYSLIALGWIAMCVAVPLFNHHRRRLGDFLAGTHVIHLPEQLLLKDLAIQGQIIAREEAEFRFLPHQLDHYGVFELQTLETFLRQNESVNSQTAYALRAEAASAIVDKVRRKIGYADPVLQKDQLRFLRAFYSAQRQHLEQRQILGDRRTDKFHAREKEKA